MTATQQRDVRGQRLRELALLFFKLGATAFGGPAAHIAMMEHEVVRRRGWMTREQLLDRIGATNLIPGPNSTELAIHIGYERAGWAGLLVAGACFITPAALIVAAIAWAYVRYGSLPASASILYGVKPVVIAIVAHALYQLGKTAVKSVLLAVIAVLAIVACAMGVNELIVLFGAAVVVMVARSRVTPMLLIPTTLPTITATAATTTASVGLLPLFLVFLKIGSVLFGSGYVLLAFLRSDFVEQRHWLSESQLLDAVAVGQITPGPVFTTATFIGYLLAGPSGAIVATIGIFLPAFVFVAITAPIIPKLRRSKPAAAMLDGLNVGSLALMAVVTYQLARAALVDPITIALAAICAIVLIFRRINSTWLILAGACVGLLRG